MKDYTKSGTETFILLTVSVTVSTQTKFGHRFWFGNWFLKSANQLAFSEYNFTLCDLKSGCTPTLLDLIQNYATKWQIISNQQQIGFQKSKSNSSSTINYLNEQLLRPYWNASDVVFNMGGCKSSRTDTGGG